MSKPLLTPFEVRYVIINRGYRKSEKVSFERFLEMREHGELSGCTWTFVS